jgi:putative PEP-CTERM system TPR-repeat lipoprotein
MTWQHHKDGRRRNRLHVGGGWAAVRLLVTAGAGLLVACGASGEKLLARAEHSLDAGQYRAAMIDLQNYISKSPDDARARALLALALVELNDIDGAEVEVRRARELGAARALTITPECRVLVAKHEFDRVLDECSLEGAPPELQGALIAIRGSAQFGKQDYASARNSFEQALALNRNDINALLGAARSAMAGGDVAAARAVFERAPQALRTQPAYLQGYGAIELATGRLDKAEEFYKQSVATYDPKDDSSEALKALAQLTEVQLSLNKLEDAENTTARMRQLASGSVAAQYYSGLVAEKQNDLERARSLFEPAALASDWPAPRVALARVNFNLGNVNQAESTLKEVLAREPDNVQAQQLMFRVRERLQSPEEALQQFQLAVDESEGDPGLEQLGFDLRMKMGDVAGARASLERAEKSGKATSPDDRIKLAAGYIAVGDPARALELLELVGEVSGATELRRNSLAVIALLRKGDREAAVARADAMVAKNPGDVPTRTVLAAIFTQARDYARARAHYASILQRNPSDTATRLKLADVEMRAGESAAATKQLQTILDGDATNEQATLQMARVALARRDAREMERWGRKAIEDHPQSAAAQRTFALQMLAVGKYDAAVQAAQTAATLAPRDVAPLVVLGAAQAAKGDLAESTATFRKAVDREPDAIGHRINLARALRLQHNLPEALQVIDAGLQREPKNVTALGVATMLSLEAGNIERAAGYAARLSAAAPDSPAALRVEGRVALAQKRYADAVAFYDKAAAKGSDSTLTVERYQAARLAGDTRADQQLEQWLEKHPDDLRVRLMLAEQLDAKGQTAAAVKHYEAALQKAPGSVIALNNLAVIYQRQKDPRALGLAKEAYDAAPGQPLVADTYGWLLVDQGKLDAGIEILRKAAAAQGATAEVRYHLAAALARDGQREPALEILRKLKTERGNGYESISSEVDRLLTELQR